MQIGCKYVIMGANRMQVYNYGCKGASMGADADASADADVSASAMQMQM